MDPGDGLYHAGETINSTGGIATDETIQRKEMVIPYKKSGTQRSRNITKAIEKLN